MKGTCIHVLIIQNKIVSKNLMCFNFIEVAMRFTKIFYTVIFQIYGNCSLRATNFVNGLKKKFEETFFMKSTLMPSLQSVICVTIEFLLTFSETNFMELLKATKLVKFVALKKGAPRYC